MWLKHLQLINFKNYAELNLDFSPNINCFLGDNGQGKTNLLDAIHYLAFCKSYFNPIDAQLVKKEETFFMLQGDFERDDKSDNIYCGYKKGQKKQFKRNKKLYEKLSEHIGLIPLVMISPSDSELIHEGSERRRRFLDLIISQFDKEYLNHLIQYNRALSQRNRLLKKFMEVRRFDEEALQIWDEQLINYGVPISNARRSFLERFIPLFQKQYEHISERKEKLDLKYLPSYEKGEFKEALINARDKDRRNTYTTVGIHKDDIAFEIEDYPLKKFGSQGQQKTFLLGLKLAQAEILKDIKSVAPILLLDDIYDKLDDKRVAALMEIVQADWFGQVFISDTHTDRLPKIFESIDVDYNRFIIKEGEHQNDE